MSGIGRFLVIHHKTVSRLLVYSALVLPAGSTETEARSFIGSNEFGTFIVKNVPIYVLASGGFHLLEGTQLCLFTADFQIL